MAETPYKYSIGVVERDTGIGRDTLRIWERRYGFPTPARNDKGARMYNEAQLSRLQRIRRLMDQGQRPGKLLTLDDQALDKLEAGLASDDEVMDETTAAVLSAVRSCDRLLLENLLRKRCETLGMRKFILQTVAPLVRSVGEQWASGQLQVYQEHFVSAQLIGIINAKLAQLPAPAEAPPVLLATLPGELHTLGLLMVDALLIASGVETINLGAELPMDQIVRAVAQFDARAIGLSFSGSYPYTHIRPHLLELRALLGNDVEIWIGGEGAHPLRKLPPGVRKFTRLKQLQLTVCATTIAD